MKTNSKKIGSAFERRIAKLLSLKISNGERDDLFWRTPSSGAMGWLGNKFEGDIMLIDDKYKWWDFIVECKTTKRGSIIPLRSSVAEYIRQCRKRYADKKWMLILQIRGKDDLFILCEEMVAKYISSSALICKIDNIYVFDFLKSTFHLTT